MENLKQKFEQGIDVPFFRPVETTVYLRDHFRMYTGKFQEVYSPIYRNGEAVYLGKYPMMTSEQAEGCLEAAEKAWNGGLGEWPMMTLQQRVDTVRKFASVMQEQREEVVTLLMWEICKTRKDAESEFDRTVDYILKSCDIMESRIKADPQDGNNWYKSAGLRLTTVRSPRGITLVMGPSNYPLNETFTTLIPALLMGNVVIFKPAKVGVLLLGPLLQGLRDCFPAGVVTTLYGEGATVISPIVRSGKLAVFAFIGSSGAADKIFSQIPNPHRTKQILGLGAKNPAIILPGCDIVDAVKHNIKGALSFNGQRCTAHKILFVHQSIITTFIDKFVDAVDTLEPGLPWEEGVDITPILPNTSERFQGLLHDAQNQGAYVVNKDGGKVVGGYMHPAVLYPVTPQMKLYRIEQFGPLVPIVPFDDIEEVIQWMETSDYGQQAAIFAGEDDREVLKTFLTKTKNLLCRTNINTSCQRGPDEIPFTGRKDSAMGTLDLTSALLEFSIEHVTAVPENDNVFFIELE